MIANRRTSLTDSFRQSSGLVARILKGENPADLPVVQPTKFGFIINLRRARQLDIVAPPGLSARTDDMISGGVFFGAETP